MNTTIDVQGIPSPTLIDNGVLCTFISLTYEKKRVMLREEPMLCFSTPSYMGSHKSQTQLEQSLQQQQRQSYKNERTKYEDLDNASVEISREEAWGTLFNLPEEVTWLI